MAQATTQQILQVGDLQGARLLTATSFVQDDIDRASLILAKDGILNWAVSSNASAIANITLGNSTSGFHNVIYNTEFPDTQTFCITSQYADAGSLGGAADEENTVGNIGANGATLITATTEINDISAPYYDFQVSITTSEGVFGNAFNGLLDGSISSIIGVDPEVETAGNYAGLMDIEGTNYNGIKAVNSHLNHDSATNTITVVEDADFNANVALLFVGSIAENATTKQLTIGSAFYGDEDEYSFTAGGSGDASANIYSIEIDSNATLTPDFGIFKITQPELTVIVVANVDNETSNVNALNLARIYPNGAIASLPSSVTSNPSFTDIFAGASFANDITDGFTFSITQDPYSGEPYSSGEYSDIYTIDGGTQSANYIAAYQSLGGTGSIDHSVIITNGSTTLVFDANSTNTSFVSIDESQTETLGNTDAGSNGLVKLYYTDINASITTEGQGTQDRQRSTALTSDSTMSNFTVFYSNAESSGNGRGNTSLSYSDRHDYTVVYDIETLVSSTAGTTTFATTGSGDYYDARNVARSNDAVLVQSVGTDDPLIAANAITFVSNIGTTSLATNLVADSEFIMFNVNQYNEYAQSSLMYDFSSDTVGNSFTNSPVSVVGTNITTQNLDLMRIELTPKTIANLSFNAGAPQIAGWTLGYTSGSFLTVKKGTNGLFNEHDYDISSLTSDDAPTYSLTALVGTNAEARNVDFLSTFVTFGYNVMYGEGQQYTGTFTAENPVKSETTLISTDVSSAINTSAYSIAPATGHVLKQTTVVTEYKVTVPFLFGTYQNMQITSDTVRQTDTFYTLFDTHGTALPDSFVRRLIDADGNVLQAHRALTLSDQMQWAFTAKDLWSHYGVVKVAAASAPSTWVAASDSVDADLTYDNQTVIPLDQNSRTGRIELSVDLEYLTLLDKSKLAINMNADPDSTLNGATVTAYKYSIADGALFESGAGFNVYNSNLPDGGTAISCTTYFEVVSGVLTMTVATVSTPTTLFTITSSASLAQDFTVLYVPSPLLKITRNEDTVSYVSKPTTAPIKIAEGVFISVTNGTIGGLVDSVANSMSSWQLLADPVSYYSYASDNAANPAYKTMHRIGDGGYETQGEDGIYSSYGNARPYVFTAYRGILTSNGVTGYSANHYESAVYVRTRSSVTYQLHVYNNDGIDYYEQSTPRNFYDGLSDSSISFTHYSGTAAPNIGSIGWTVNFYASILGSNIGSGEYTVDVNPASYTWRAEGLAGGQSESGTVSALNGTIIAFDNFTFGVRSIFPTNGDEFYSLNNSIQPIRIYYAEKQGTGSKLGSGDATLLSGGSWTEFTPVTPLTHANLISSSGVLIKNPDNSDRGSIRLKRLITNAYAWTSYFQVVRPQVKFSCIAAFTPTALPFDEIAATKFNTWCDVGTIDGDDNFVYNSADYPMRPFTSSANASINDIVFRRTGTLRTYRSYRTATNSVLESFTIRSNKVAVDLYYGVDTESLIAHVYDGHISDIANLPPDGDYYTDIADEESTWARTGSSPNVGRYQLNFAQSLTPIGGTILGLDAQSKNITIDFSNGFTNASTFYLTGTVGFNTRLGVLGASYEFVDDEMNLILHNYKSDVGVDFGLEPFNDLRSITITATSHETATIPITWPFGATPFNFQTAVLAAINGATINSTVIPPATISTWEIDGEFDPRVINVFFTALSDTGIDNMRNMFVNESNPSKIMMFQNLDIIRLMNTDGIPLFRLTNSGIVKNVAGFQTSTVTLSDGYAPAQFLNFLTGANSGNA